MDRMEVRNHRIYRNGSPVPYRQTPNGGTALTPTGIIVHDTAGDLPGTGSISWLTNPAAKASAHFVVGIDGSLTQLQALNRQTWHAGKSQYQGRQNCNGFTIGIEIANPGAMVKYGEGYSNGGANPAKGVKIPRTMDVREASSPNHGKAFWLAYSDAQIAVVTELCRAIKAAYKIEFISTHWEICIPKGRKVDTNPLFPLDELRAAVFGGAAPPAPAAAPIAGAVKTPPTLRKGSTGDDVKRLQAALHVFTDGDFGPKTEAALKEFQKASGLVADGICGPQTWKALS